MRAYQAPFRGWEKVKWYSVPVGAWLLHLAVRGVASRAEVYVFSSLPQSPELLVHRFWSGINLDREHIVDSSGEFIHYSGWDLSSSKHFLRRRKLPEQRTSPNLFMLTSRQNIRKRPSRHSIRRGGGYHSDRPQRWYYYGGVGRPHGNGYLVGSDVVAGCAVLCTSHAQ